MNRILSVIAPLLAAGSARMLGDVGAYQVPASSSFSILSSIYSFLVSVNPFILIVLGVTVFFAGKLARFVGVVIVVLGLIGLLFPYLLTAV